MYRLCLLVAGTAVLSLSLGCKKSVSPNVAATVNSHSITYAELDKQYQALVERGVRFESPPADQPWLWREAYLRDPDGNLLCLYFAGENRRFPPWRVGAKDRMTASNALGTGEIQD